MLDLSPDPYFDRLVRSAATICRTPIAFVGLFTDSTEWIKAKHGIDAVSAPRELTFCQHTLNQADLFVVEDALLDDRFKDNPFVTGDPHVRFYTGMRVLDGTNQPVGSLCVIDRVPRQLDRIQRNNLRQLAMLVRSRLLRKSA